MVAKVINCECGYQARGETDEELLADAHKHIDEVHPDMKGKVSDDDLLAQAEEA
jgi:predicted small metal-binding protein